MLNADAHTAGSLLLLYNDSVVVAVVAGCCVRPKLHHLLTTNRKSAANSHYPDVIWCCPTNPQQVEVVELESHALHYVKLYMRPSSRLSNDKNINFTFLCGCANFP